MAALIAPLIVIWVLTVLLGLVVGAWWATAGCEEELRWAESERKYNHDECCN